MVRINDQKKEKTCASSGAGPPCHKRKEGNCSRNAKTIVIAKHNKLSFTQFFLNNSFVSSITEVKSNSYFITDVFLNNVTYPAKVAQ